MRYFGLFLALLLSTNSFAQMKTFEPQESIKASDINQNFNHIKGLFQSKGQSLPFDSYNAGQVIEKTGLESDFERVRDLGFDVASLASEKILAEELNQAFSDMLLGAITFDDIPLVNNTMFNVNEDAVLSNSVSFTNNVGTSQVQIQTQPTHGLLNINATSGAFTYTPNANYFGLDSFTFNVFDGAQTSSLATVSIDVTSVNDIPVLAAKSISPVVNTATSDNLSASDLEGSSLTYSINTQGVKGVTVVNSNGSFTYTPNANATGSDSFTVRAFDGLDYSLPLSVGVNILTSRSCTNGDGTGNQTWNTSTNAWNSCIIASCANQKVISPDQLECIYTIASGGVITMDGNYRVHTFNGNGTFTISSGKVSGFEMLIVAGGGGGGTSKSSLGGAGGGGAGGLIHRGSETLALQSYAIAVGNGGAAGTTGAGTFGTNGQHTTFGSLYLAYGGGAGAHGQGGANGNGGGSGGGAGYNTYSSPRTGGAGVANQGYAGGNTPNTSPSSGAGGAGGGGAGGVGGNHLSPHTGGNGGPGRTFSISGTSFEYAKGGVGAGNRGLIHGPANSGQGGSGGYSTEVGGAGGSGVVIVRYLYR